MSDSLVSDLSETLVRLAAGEPLTDLAREGYRRLARFKLGDRVTWSSTVAGVTAEKVGTVVEVVAPWIFGSNGAGRPQLFKVPGVAGRRTRTSYVVRVVDVDRSRTYWPRPDRLVPA